MKTIYLAKFLIRSTYFDVDFADRRKNATTFHFCKLRTQRGGMTPKKP